MGDYAASIRVITKIDTKDMSKLDSAFAKVAERAAIAKDKVEALDKAGTPHNAEIYQKSVAELDKLNRELDKVKGNVKKVESQSELSKIKGSFSSLSDEVEDYSTRLKDLRDKGYGPGDQVFDDVYKGWKNAQYAEEEYFKSLNSKTDKGVAEQTAKIARQKEKEAQIQAKARERELEQQRRIEAAAEKNLQTVNAQLEKEAQIQVKQQAKEAEERRLGDIKKNAIVSDHKMVALLQEQIVLQQRLTELKQAGVTSGYQEYDEITNKLKHIDIKLKDTETGFQKISKAARKGFSGVGGILKSVQSGIQKMGSLVKRVFKRFNDDAKKSNGLLSIMKSRLGGIALSLLVFNWITRGFNAMMAGMKEGLQNLAHYSKEYNAVMSDMVSALATLKNSFATAFAPIASIVIPFLTQLINALTSAVNKIAQFIAALTGKSTWTRAKKQNIDYAESLDKVSKTAKDAYRSLADFDELTVLSKNETADTDDGIIKPEDMFEEVAIDSKIKELADKFKKILAKLFAPLKEAWKREGKFVMDSWKYALDEVGKLLKDIGRDFFEVWNQEATIKIFQDILHIVGDIGLIVGNLAQNFRKAWNENKVGKKILENIRDLFGIIVANIRDAADFTVEWSKNINFTPLLNAFEQFTDSLKPVVDFLSGILTDFYKQVLLPLGQWVIEKGLPDLLDVLTAFNERVDWAALRQRLSDFWDHVEPFAETMGEGLILFIEKCAIALGDFLNSPAFESFLTTLEKWMDNTDPEDIAKGLELICTAILGYKAVSGLTSAFIAVKGFLDIFKGGATVGKGIESTTKSTSGLSAALGSLAIATAGVYAVDKLTDAAISLGEAAGLSAQQADYMRDRYHEGFLGITGKVNAAKDVMSIFTNGVQGLGWEMSNTLGTSSAFENALTQIADGAIYTDEQLEKMRKNYGFTIDDTETLRQAMLDANPALRDLADGFGLFDASAQTLQDVSAGMEAIKEKSFNGVGAFEEYALKAGYTSEAIQFLKDQLSGSQVVEDFEKVIFFASQSIEGFGNNITLMGNSVEDMKNKIIAAGAETITGFLNGFTGGTGAVEETVLSTFQNIIDTAHEILGIHSPSTVFAAIGQYLIEGLINGIVMVQTGLNTALNNVYTTVTGIFDNIKSYVGSMIDAIQSKISAFTSGISSVWGTVTSTVSGLFGGGRSAPAVYGGSYKIPALATGGITTGTTIAKIGEAGREAVLPLERNTGWMDTLANKINGGGDMTLTVNLDGREIYRNVVERSQIARSSGRPAFDF